MSTSTSRGDYPSLKELQNARPVEARHAFRRGFHFKKQTGGLCRGFVQANVAGFHGSVAEDFAEFCRANEGPLPLLYHSSPGVFSAHGIADDSDIRTDLAAYSVFRYGKYTDVLKDLLQFGDELNEYAFFYTGCSFTFDRILIDAGIPLVYADDPEITTSMYTTNVLCYPVGSFHGPMVVSMRPIPRELVQVAVRSTNPLTDVHGAPIHIGNPGSIGIQDLYKTEYGDPPPPLQENTVPVFWACGNTIKEVMTCSKHPLSFTMYADCMYIADRADSQSGTKAILENEEPIVVDIVDKPYTASLVSVAVQEKIKRLQQILGNRSTCSLLTEDTLLRTSLLASHASSIALMVALLPINSCTDDNENHHYINTNGVLGAVSLSIMLQALGKEVTLLIDPGCMSYMKETLASLLQKGILERTIQLRQYPPVDSAVTARDFLTHTDGATPRFDLLMSLHLTTDMADACFNKTQRQLFQAANGLPMFTSSGCHSTFVGNDLKQSAVDLYGDAIAIALYLLRMCPSHDRYRRRGIGFPPTDSESIRFGDAMPSITRELSILEILVKHQDVNNENTSLDELLDQGTLQLLLGVL